MECWEKITRQNIQIKYVYIRFNLHNTPLIITLQTVVRLKMKKKEGKLVKCIIEIKRV